MEAGTPWRSTRCPRLLAMLRDTYDDDAAFSLTT
jgi:hypothetical protein